MAVVRACWASPLRRSHSSDDELSHRLLIGCRRLYRSPALSRTPICDSRGQGGRGCGGFSSGPLYSAQDLRTRYRRSRGLRPIVRWAGRTYSFVCFSAICMECDPAPSPAALAQRVSEVADRDLFRDEGGGAARGRYFLVCVAGEGEFVAFSALDEPDGDVEKSGRRAPDGGRGVMGGAGSAPGSRHWSKDAARIPDQRSSGGGGGRHVGALCRWDASSQNRKRGRELWRRR